MEVLKGKNKVIDEMYHKTVALQWQKDKFYEECFAVIDSGISAISRANGFSYNFALQMLGLRCCDIRELAPQERYEKIFNAYISLISPIA